jgi:hypothetical protein
VVPLKVELLREIDLFQRLPERLHQFRVLHLEKAAVHLHEFMRECVALQQLLSVVPQSEHEVEDVLREAAPNEEDMPTRDLLPEQLVTEELLLVEAPRD